MAHVKVDHRQNWVQPKLVASTFGAALRHRLSSYEGKTFTARNSLRDEGSSLSDYPMLLLPIISYACEQNSHLLLGFRGSKVAVA
jgi:hypothetical protein